jgi:hypothetical protein
MQPITGNRDVLGRIIVVAVSAVEQNTCTRHGPPIDKVSISVTDVSNQTHRHLLLGGSEREWTVPNLKIQAPVTPRRDSLVFEPL